MENEKDFSNQIEPVAGKSAQEETEGLGNPAGAEVQAPPAVKPKDIVALEAANEKLLVEKQDLYDRLLRKQAEFENYRKRIQREKHELIEHANAELIRSLLPSLDGFERALKHRDAGVPEVFYKGLELIYRELLEVLTRAGLAPVETLGKIFDPHLHQAVETVEAAGHRDQEILEELQKGYKLKHRLLRPAVVKVVVAPKEANPAAKPKATTEDS